MRTGTKLGAFGLLLAGLLGAGAALGAAVGPIDTGGADDHGDMPADEAPATGTLPAGGLLVSQEGYTLVPEDRLADAGELAFSIVGPGGTPVESYEVVHDRELHLIVASRDLQQFAHLHPERDDTGRWTVELPALPPGPYRAFADFQASGAQPLTLGVDLIAPGSAGEPAALVPRSRDVVDGFEVTLDGAITPGSESEVSVTVRHDGAVVTTDPYLGSAGHLVALREGDLAYLHVHPLDAEPAGAVRFAVEVPSPGTYALFFDFRLDGEVRTARFVVAADRASTTTTHTEPDAGHGDGESH